MMKTYIIKIPKGNSEDVAKNETQIEPIPAVRVRRKTMKLMGFSELEL